MGLEGVEEVLRGLLDADAADLLRKQGRRQLQRTRPGKQMSTGDPACSAHDDQLLRKQSGKGAGGFTCMYSHA